MNTTSSTPNAAGATQPALPQLGARVTMTAENSNWNVGESGIVTWIGGDRVAVAFDGREDDYTVFLTDFTISNE